MAVIAHEVLWCDTAECDGPAIEDPEEPGTCDECAQTLRWVEVVPAADLRGAGARPERVDAVMDLIERALSDAIKHLVATGNRTPYPDDPRWSPWTRFQKPLIDKLVTARDQHRGAVEERDRLATENARLRGEYADMAARLKSEYEAGMRDSHAGGQ